jgi:hypothetical protein
MIMGPSKVPTIGHPVAPSPSPATPPSDDASEATDLRTALEALEISEADDPTHDETHRLRRDVVEAAVALERKQQR